MVMEAVFGQKYKLESSENFDEFMQASGVGAIVRRVANKLSPVIELKKENDEYTLISASGIKTTTFKFMDGVEFDQLTPDGRKVRSIITVNGNTFHEIQIDGNGKESTIDRIYSNDTVIMVLKVGGITSTRIYKLQQ